MVVLMKFLWLLISRMVSLFMLFIFLVYLG